ncbi:MAG: hypothetical protein AAGC92_03005 [Pseudomonadota bacterium]
MPNKPREGTRRGDRPVIIAVIPVIRHGLMRRDAPERHRPHKTLYNRFINRFIRWSEAGVFDRIFTELAAGSAATDRVMIDATHLKAHRSATRLIKKGRLPALSGGPKAT